MVDAKTIFSFGFGGRNHLHGRIIDCYNAEIDGCIVKIGHPVFFPLPEGPIVVGAVSGTPQVQFGSAIRNQQIGSVFR